MSIELLIGCSSNAVLGAVVKIAGNGDYRWRFVRPRDSLFIFRDPVGIIAIDPGAKNM